jgi:predicted nucleic acid-binding protein
MQQLGTQGLGWMDAFIVATAWLAGVPVLTRDRRLVDLLGQRAEFALYD